MQLILNGILAGGEYAVIAIGFSLIYAATRFFHFAYGAVVMCGAYLAFALHQAGLPLPPAMALSVTLCAGLGAGMEAGIYRQLRRRQATPLVLLIASLGVFIMIQNTISLVFGDDTRTIRTGVVREGLEILGARIVPVQITIIATSLVLFIALSLLLSKTKLGRQIRAVASDRSLRLLTESTPTGSYSPYS